MVDRLTVSKGEKRTAGLIILGVVIGLIALFWFCGSARAATLEARVGDRDGAATVGLALDVSVEHVRVGALLEFGEDDSVSLIARLSKAWPNRVTPYAGLGLGVAFQDVPAQGRAIPPDGRHGRRYAATEGTERNSGLSLEAFLGVRGAIKPGLAWFMEAAARDQQVNDGLGGAVGLRWRCGK